jgi:hypothetical protein
VVAGHILLKTYEDIFRNDRRQLAGVG